MIRVAVKIKGGDRDCSSAVCECGEVAGVIPPATYMWTGNERGILAGAGFVRVSKWAARRGDVAWRTGHTEIVLSRGMVGGARIDEVGGTHGPREGDQTGREVAQGPWDPDKWDECWRYVGTKTVAGIPVGEAMAQVMEHLIVHAEHGYSQDHRDGDGTLETVWLAWGGPEEPEPLDVDGWLGASTITRCRATSAPSPTARYGASGRPTAGAIPPSRARSATTTAPAPRSSAPCRRSSASSPTASSATGSSAPSKHGSTGAATT